MEKNCMGSKLILAFLGHIGSIFMLLLPNIKRNQNKITEVFIGVFEMVN